MFRNYLKTALRQLWKNKLFSALNIFGLATSISVCLLLILILADQYGYDTFHEKKDRIYRVVSAKAEAGTAIERPEYATTALSLAEPLAEAYPFVEKTVRILGIGGSLRAGEKTFETGGAGFAVDPTFLEVFSFGWLAGDRQSALSLPRSIVLAKGTAGKLFPATDPLGQTVELGELGAFTVTGLIPDPPVRSHIKFDFLLSYASVHSFSEKERESISLFGFDQIWRGLVYVLVREQSDRRALDRALNELAAAFGTRDTDHDFLFVAQALSEVMPSRDLTNEIGAGTPHIVLYFLMVLGVIIMVSAGFNYVNLSVARSLKRAREIGIRKVTGARRRDIVLQFLGEAVLIALIALMAAIGLLDLLIPAFYGLDPFVEDSFTLTKTPAMYGLFLGFSLLAGLLAGLFPALNISTYRPIVAIRQMADIRLLSRIGLRKALITFQFALSLIFILAVLIVLQQQHYVLNTDLGTRTENLLNIRMEGVDHEVFTQRVRQLPGVESVAASERVILTGENASTTVIFDGGADSMQLHYNIVSPNYLKVQDIELIAGRHFPAQKNARGEQFIILNETAVRRMGYADPAEALGDALQLDTLALTVIGIARDFHHDNIWFAPIKPFGLRSGGDYARNVHMVLREDNIPATIQGIRSTWEGLAPDKPMQAFFTDERVYYMNKFFRMGARIIGFIGFLTILIASMGLLGMVIYTVEGRVKEVGIRKVLGAGEVNIIWRLSKGFFRLLFMAAALAIPVALIGANLWLDNFRLRTPIEPGVVLIGLLVLLILGLTTVISQTYLAAKRNPVDALRVE